jgi:hypothetical protein
MTLEVQEQGAISSDGILAGRVPRKHRESPGKKQGLCVYVLVSLPFLIKVQGISTLTTLSNPNYLPSSLL